MKIVNISLMLGITIAKKLHNRCLAMIVSSEFFFIESSFIEQKLIDDPISNSSLKPQIMTK